MMTSKKPVTLLILFLLFLTLILKFLGYHTKEDPGIIGFFGRLLNETQHFAFTTTGIDKNDIDITWQSDDHSAILVKDGVSINNFGYDYGPNTFTVIYKDSVRCARSFFSQNNNDVYNVKIDITGTANTIDVTYLFDGRPEKTTILLY
jgi:hypothetical protein